MAASPALGDLRSPGRPQPRAAPRGERLWRHAPGGG